MIQTNVIIVEDDRNIRESFVEMLELSGINVDGVDSAMAFYQAINTACYDVAVIDIGLPDQSGLQIVEFLREKTGLGIILLTARGSVPDRVKGYESGADHYFIKPVDGFELVAAIHSLQRRLTGMTGKDEICSCWRLDKSTWKLVCPEGGEVKMTAKEIVFLETLMNKSNETVSRSEMMKVLQYSNNEYGNRSMDTLLRRLRKKVETEINKVLPVQTVHATGYCFSASAMVLVGR